MPTRSQPKKATGKKAESRSNRRRTVTNAKTTTRISRRRKVEAAASVILALHSEALKELEKY
jgi:hypothetical protein